MLETHSVSIEIPPLDELERRHTVGVTVSDDIVCILFPLTEFRDLSDVDIELPVVLIDRYGVTA